MDEFKLPTEYKTYAVDFDGTIVTSAFPKIGKIKQKTVDLMNKIHARGDRIILWTCRCGKYLEEAEAFLKKNNIPYDYVNKNPDFPTGGPKVFADHYIDDRAIDVEDIDNLEVMKMDKVAEYKDQIYKMADFDQANFMHMQAHDDAMRAHTQAVDMQNLMHQQATRLQHHLMLQQLMENRQPAPRDIIAFIKSKLKIKSKKEASENASFEKMAKQSKKKRVVEGVAGAALLSGSKDRILGRRLYTMEHPRQTGRRLSTKG